MDNVTAVNEAWNPSGQMSGDVREWSSVRSKDKNRSKSARDKQIRMIARPESSEKVTKVKAVAERSSAITVIPSTRKHGSYLNTRDVGSHDLLTYSFTFNTKGNQDLLPFVPYGYFSDKSTSHYEWLVDFKNLLLACTNISELIEYLSIVCGTPTVKSQFRNYFIPLLTEVEEKRNECASHPKDVSIYDMEADDFNQRVLCSDTLCTCYWRILFRKYGYEEVITFFDGPSDIKLQYFNDESHKLCDVNSNVMVTYSYYFKNLFKTDDHYDTLAMISLSEQVIKVTNHVSKFLTTKGINNEMVSATYGKAKEGSRRLYLSVTVASADDVIPLNEQVHECLNQYRFCYFGFLMRYGILNFTMNRYEMHDNKLGKCSEAVYFGPVQMHEMTFENNRTISAYSSPLSNANLMITCLARPLGSEVHNNVMSSNRRAIMSAIMYYIETNYVLHDQRSIEMKVEVNEDFRLKYSRELSNENLISIYEGLKESIATEANVKEFTQKIIDILFKSVGPKSLTSMDGHRFDVCIIVKRGKSNAWRNSSTFDQWMILPTIVIGDKYFNDRMLQTQSSVSMTSGCPKSTEVGVVRFGV
nr:MAG: hypothetical protein [Halyomorpha halys reo-like associated virus 1]